jgi:L-ascorbate metabolism protein UlaG (beta-lactamase superfamily)
VRIDYLGHACFHVTGGGGRSVVFDPYEPGCYGGGLTLAAPAVRADLVFASHAHADHGAVGQVAGARAVTAAGPGGGSGVSWVGVAAFHDTTGGAERGTDVIFNVKLDGLALCHLGDLGHALSPREVGALGRVDILFAPVGGHFTIDAAGALAAARLLNPRVLVPMHFRTAKVAFPIAGLDAFLELCPWPVERRGGSVEFGPEALPAGTTVWVMEALR